MNTNKFLKFSIAAILAFSLTNCATPGGSPTATSASDSINSKPQAVTIPGDGTSSNSSTSHKDTSGAAPEPYVVPGSGGSSGSYPAAPMATSLPAPDERDSSAAAPTAGGAAPPMATIGGTADVSTVTQQPEYKKLSAGDIDDNEKFSDYLTYLNKYGTALKDNRDVLKVDISNRVIISVQDSNQKGIPDSNVQVESGGKTVFSGKTYSNGKTLFFPARVLQAVDCQQQQEDCSVAANYSVTVEKDGLKTTKTFSSGSTNWNIALTSQRDAITSPNLDITFLIDATGSMGDEINSVQNTIKDISDKINAMDIKSKIRYSLVSYKDRTDAYRVKRYDFTSSLSAYQEILNDLSASGGGDYRESLNEGLYHAVNNISWTEQDDAVRLVFLIADAPPHLDYSDDTPYTDSMVQAVKKGIKIYPVAASGLDDSGEYIFRQLAQFTYAKFLFLTYGGDEQTPGTTTHHVGEFQENNLDSLVVNIVKEELNNLK
jgi:hypothetical protein